MAYKNKALLATRAPASSSYVDFDPKSELKQEEGVDTLIISLPGFKKEQLRVQVSNVGILKVSGEKTEIVEGTSRKRVFVKETKVPEGCDMNEIRAKFTSGELRVIMPKKLTPPPPPTTTTTTPPTSVAEQHQKKEETASTSAAPMISEAAQIPKPDTPAPADNQHKGDQSIVNGKMGAITSHYDQSKDQILGLRNTLLANLEGKKSTLAIGFGVAMAAMVAVGAYVAYKYGSSSSPSYLEE